MTAPDVIVAGLGTVGAAACLALARLGVTVQGFDAFAPPHSNGSHHGLSRSIRRAYLEGTVYVPMALRAWEQWRRLERDTGLELLVTSGNLTIGPADGTAVSGFLASARAHDIPHTCLTAAEVRRRWPQLAVPSGLVAGLEHEAGILHAERCIAALLDRARQAGAALQVNERVRHWRVGRHSIRVTTDRGVYQTGRLLLAAGARNPRLLGHAFNPLSARRVAVHWIDPPPGDDFRHGVLPVNFWQLPPDEGHAGRDCREFYCLPAFPRGARVKVAAHNHLPTCDPDSPQPAVMEHEKTARNVFLKTCLPGLVRRPSRTTVCFYTQTPDGDFWLGPLPEQPDVLVCALAGHGFKFAPVLGEVLAALLTDRTPAYDLSRFATNRFDREG